MRSLISALVAAGFVFISASAFADDVKVNPKPAQPGRTAEDDGKGVKSQGAASKPGRTAEESKKQQ